MNSKHPRKPNEKVLAVNRKARHDYFIEDRFEAGLVLEGWEVKCLRAGRAQLSESYVQLRNGDAWLIGAHFADPGGDAKAGESYVVFGTATPPASLDLGSLSNSGITLLGIAAFDNSGISVSSAGDVNGDGFADLLIGDNAALLDVSSLSTLRATSIRTTDLVNATGGGDTIKGNEDDDVILGGVGDDVIDGNTGRDLILGDQGELTSRAEEVSTNPRFRALTGGLLYDSSNGDVNTDTTWQAGPAADITKCSNWGT